jgi:pimeloyl-ACP methyl ester carboxylesterase
MIYDYKPGKKKTTWLVIHGLGDDMTNVEELTSLAEESGYGVLRVDLFGHGETLKKYLHDHKGELPESLNYSDNVVVVREMLEGLGIKDVVIVGHSYGGGIAYGVAAALGNIKGPKKIKVRSVHMLAPYVQRIDKFLRNYFQSPTFLVHQASLAMEKVGLPGDSVRSIMEPMYRFTWSMTSHLKFMSDLVTRLLTVDKFQDLAMDPWLESYMKSSYRQYFVHMAGKPESEMSKAEIEEIDVKVEAAIKVTKGIRDFDLLDASVPMPSPEAPLQIVGGAKDLLVIPGQLHEFDQRLNSAIIGHSLEFVEGEDSHHLFPRTMAKMVFQKILEFQKKEKKGGD